MLTEERRELMVKLINEEGAVTVAELMDRFDASAATIRRDLNALNDAHKIIKVFGGATSLSQPTINTVEDAVAIKSTRNVEEKDVIGKYAASLIQDTDFVYIDSGTSTLKMIDYIGNTKAKFITNGIVHAKKMIDKGLSTMIIGGKLKPATEAIVGPDSIEAISKYHFTKAFMGTNGVSLDAGFTTPDVEEARLKTEAINHSYMKCILADHSKFGQVSSVSFAPISKCAIITDQTPDKRYLDKTVIKALSEL
ncbi:MAG: DeoR/GlpR transcriptional regulator [Butyrivibrio sp.]|nr:DeoR/GlpR transcriptional regulator [Butyrivibrio sp.]